MHFPTVKIPTVVDVTVEYFEDLVLNGILVPGTVLPSERRLSETLNISRTSLRTALAKLDAMGVIELGNKGAVVQNIFNALIDHPLDRLMHLNISELYEIWDLLVTSASLKSCERRTKEDIDQLSMIVDKIEYFVSIESKSGCTENIIEFYDNLSASTYNFLHTQILNFINKPMHDAFNALATEMLDNKSLSDAKIQDFRSVVNAIKTFNKRSILKTAKKLNKELETIVIDIDKQPVKQKAHRKNDEDSAPADHAQLKLTEFIISEKIRKGEDLPQVEDLARELELSQTSIRAAISKLETLGHVKVIKRKQVQFLGIPDAKSVFPLLVMLRDKVSALEAIFEFRQILEEEAAFLAAERHSQKDLKKLANNLKALEKYRDNTDNDKYAVYDIEFHRTIASMSGNRALKEISKALTTIFESVTEDWLHLHQEQKGSISEIHEQHTAIYDTIADRKAKAAKTAMHNHLTYVIDMMRSFSKTQNREQISKLRVNLYNAKNVK